MLNAIATERRKELVGEGHRFFDLKRTTRSISRVSCSAFCTLGPTARAWTWPIPQPEIDANPALPGREKASAARIIAIIGIVLWVIGIIFRIIGMASGVVH